MKKIILFLVFITCFFNKILSNDIIHIHALKNTNHSEIKFIVLEEVTYEEIEEQTKDFFELCERDYDSDESTKANHGTNEDYKKDLIESLSADIKFCLALRKKGTKAYILDANNNISLANTQYGSDLNILTYQTTISFIDKLKQKAYLFLESEKLDIKNKLKTTDALNPIEYGKECLKIIIDIYERYFEKINKI